MSPHSQNIDPAWPPGTVRLDGKCKILRIIDLKLSSSDFILDLNVGSEVILEPKPSKDPNDPLVSIPDLHASIMKAVLIHIKTKNWPRWRKHLNFGLVSYYVVMVMAL
jgi:hypothetical protein